LFSHPILDHDPLILKCVYITAARFDLGSISGFHVGKNPFGTTTIAKANILADWFEMRV